MGKLADNGRIVNLRLLGLRYAKYKFGKSPLTYWDFLKITLIYYHFEETHDLGVSGDLTFCNVIYKNEQPSVEIVSMKKEENEVVLILTHLFYISHIYSEKEE